MQLLCECQGGDFLSQLGSQAEEQASWVDGKPSQHINAQYSLKFDRQAICCVRAWWTCGMHPQPPTYSIALSVHLPPFPLFSLL